MDSDSGSDDEPCSATVRELSLTHQPVIGGGFLFHPGGTLDGGARRAPEFTTLISFIFITFRTPFCQSWRATLPRSSQLGSTPC